MVASAFVTAALEKATSTRRKPKTHTKTTWNGTRFNWPKKINGNLEHKLGKCVYRSQEISGINGAEELGERVLCTATPTKVAAILRRRRR